MALSFSRIAHESTLSPLVILLALYFFYRAFNNEKYRLNFVLGGLFLGLSFYTYRTSRLIAPLLVLILTLFFAKKALQRWPFLVVSGAVAAMVIFPYIHMDFIAPDSGTESRLADVLILYRANPLALFIKNYRSYFSFAYLFSSGEMDTMPGMGGVHGMFQYYMLVLIPAGLIFIMLSAIAETPVRQGIHLPRHRGNPLPSSRRSDRHSSSRAPFVYRNPGV